MEVWYLNAEPYIRECRELCVAQYLFRSGYLRRRDIDPEKFADLFLPPPTRYRILIIEPTGTLELRRGFTRERPYAVYPTWDYLIDDIATLEELLAKPTGANRKACTDDRYPLPERPVIGQEHRVVVTGSPSLATGMGKRFAGTLRELQEDYPNAIVHVHGLSSFRVMFGFGFASVDYNPTRGEHLTLPNGKNVPIEDARIWQKWIHLLGFKVGDLAQPRQRVLYNMKSAEWASLHFTEDLKFATRGHHDIDPDEINPAPIVNKTVRSRQRAATVGDKLLCDTCSLACDCKYYREGQVCTLPGSETATLATLFRSRDPDKIIDGLGSIIGVQTERLNDAVLVERESGGPKGPLDPEVTKLAGSVFEQGVKLAKLLAPARFATGSKVAINIGGSQATVSAASPQEMVAGVMRELQEQGYSHEQITPELVNSFIERKSGADQRPELEAPIDAVVVDDEDAVDAAV